MISFWQTLFHENGLKVRIVDVGAMPAPETYHRLLNQDLARVIAYEPNPAGCKVLNQLSPDLQAYEKVIGNGEPGTFYFNRLPYTSSLYPVDTSILKYLGRSEGFETIKTFSVETHRLDNCTETQGCDLLKLDVQGAEMDVLEGSIQRLAEVMVIQIEVCFIPFYQNQPLFAELDIFLRQQGFMLHTFLQDQFFTSALQPLSQTHPGQQLLWTDALYFKHPEILMQAPPTKLLKQAMILDLCYGSPDAAALTLEIYDQRMESDICSAFLQAQDISVQKA